MVNKRRANVLHKKRSLNGQKYMKRYSTSEGTEKRKLNHSDMPPHPVMAKTDVTDNTDAGKGPPLLKGYEAELTMERCLAVSKKHTRALHSATPLLVFSPWKMKSVICRRMFRADLFLTTPNWKLLQEYINRRLNEVWHVHSGVIRHMQQHMWISKTLCPVKKARGKSVYIVRFY